MSATLPATARANGDGSRPVTGQAELALRVATPTSWAEQALSDPLALLNDHAHLEKKAAANALGLLNRWPKPAPDPATRSAATQWARLLAAIARDETEHLARVLRLLEKRGGSMSRGHRNAYAAALHRHVRTGRGPGELEDLLLVSALIEARSCERFALLGAATKDKELQALYAALERSERGHHRVFLDLAEALPRSTGLADRWSRWLDLEAEIIPSQPPGPTMHSGWSSPA